MSAPASAEQMPVIAHLLGTGKTIKEIAKFAEIAVGDVAAAARELNLEPTDPVQKQAKELFGSSDGLTYADIAAALNDKGLSNSGSPIHYLTVATWASSYGWPWGGSEDGSYSPDRPAGAANRSKYKLRVSKAMAAEINSAGAIRDAADAAWNELANDTTTVVAVAVVKGAASAGVTDIDEVKRTLMKRHGDAIKSARA